jgi:hypothetical protein
MPVKEALVTDIFREVEEDVRQEQLTDFLKTHGIKIAVGLGALVLAFGGYNYVQDQNAEEASVASDQYAAAVELVAEDPAGATARFGVIRMERGEADYGLLAAFREAEVLASRGEVEMAVVVYDQLAAGGADKFVRNLAAFYAASVLIASDDAASGAARLEPLLEEGNPLRSLALESKAYWLLSTGKVDEARNIFTELQAISAEGTSYGSRASQMLNVTGSGEQVTAE